MQTEPEFFVHSCLCQQGKHPLGKMTAAFKMALEAATEGNSLEMDLLLEKKMEFPWKQDREGDSKGPNISWSGKGGGEPGWAVMNYQDPGVINMGTGTKAYASYSPGTS